MAHKFVLNTYTFIVPCAPISRLLMPRFGGGHSPYWCAILFSLSFVWRGFSPSYPSCIQIKVTGWLFGAGLAQCHSKAIRGAMSTTLAQSYQRRNTQGHADAVLIDKDDGWWEAPCFNVEQLARLGAHKTKLASWAIEGMSSPHLIKYIEQANERWPASPGILIKYIERVGRWGFGVGNYLLNI